MSTLLTIIGLLLLAGITSLLWTIGELYYQNKKKKKIK